VVEASVKQVESQVYNKFRIFDTSVLPFDVGVETFTQFNLSLSLGLYNLFAIIYSYGTTLPVPYYMGVVPCMQINFATDVKKETTQYTVDSLDILLGVIGGFSGLIWSIMGCCVGGYETFRQETEQLESFYSSDKNVKSAEIFAASPDHPENRDAHQQGNGMLAKVKLEFEGRQEYQYLYCDHFTAWLLSFFECFCKNSKCLRKRVDRLNFHNECVDLLTGETDIVNMVRTLR